MSRIWLIGAVTAVLALLVGGIVIALVTSRGPVKLLPADSPEGAVQRYLLALEGEDFREAYSYLSRDLRARCSLDEFIRRDSWRGVDGDRVALEETRSWDGQALVRARVTVFDPGDPFGAAEYSYDRTFHVRLEEGQWRLVEPDWWCPPR